MIPIAKPIVGDEEKNAMLRVADSGCVAQGPEVAAFEKEFGEFCGAEYAVATTSGTTALQLALMALGIGGGDEVITTPFSFIASSSAIIHAGATPVFCDIEPETFNLDADQIEKYITKKTKAILPVHLYGHPAEMDKINTIAEKHNLLVIEDACQAHGAKYKGKTVGALGDAGCFSFYPTKNMMTGEGGIALFKSKDAFDKALMLRAHGMKVRYYHEIIGFNMRMTDIHASIGREQLKKLPGFNAKRQANAAYLLEHITNKKVILPVTKPDCEHVFHQFTVRIEGTEGFDILARDRAVEKLTKMGIGTGIHYPVCINEQKPFTAMGYKATNTPVAVTAARQVVSLPVHPALSENDLEQIAQAANCL